MSSSSCRFKSGSRYQRKQRPFGLCFLWYPGLEPWSRVAGGNSRLRLDIRSLRAYNVITMRTTIIAIGNSKGIRIPKLLLEESGINKDVEVKASKNGLRITPVKSFSRAADKAAAFSEMALRKDWDKPEEDAAWAKL